MNRDGIIAWAFWILVTLMVAAAATGLGWALVSLFAWAMS